jgi:hypothetical protein
MQSSSTSAFEALNASRLTAELLFIVDASPFVSRNPNLVAQPWAWFDDDALHDRRPSDVPTRLYDTARLVPCGSELFGFRPALAGRGREAAPSDNRASPFAFRHRNFASTSVSSTSRQIVAFHTAEPLNLFRRQAQAGHFQILGSDTFEQSFRRRYTHDDLTTQSRCGGPHRTPQFVLCEQPVVQVASVLTTTLFVELVRATSDVAVCHGRRS